MQARLKKIGIAGIALVIGLIVAPLDGTIALAGAVFVAIVVGVGFWITSGHVREWNERLREIDCARPRASTSPAP